MKSAVIAAVVAAIVASGSSVAATSLIDGRSIKDGSIPLTKLSTEAVASLRGVRDVSLVEGPVVTVPAGSGATTKVQCPSGALAVSGGIISTVGGPFFLQQFGPGTGDSKSRSWTISLINGSQTNPGAFHAFATCVTS